MARQIYRTKISITSVGASGQAFLYANLTDDEGAIIPATFNNVPFVKVVSLGGRHLYVDDASVTTTGFTVKSGAVGSAPPIPALLEVINRDATAITGPTPPADFSAQNEEMLCTPFDMRLEHANLVLALDSDAKLMRYCRRAKSIITGQLRKLYADEASLKAAAPWFNGFYADTRNVPTSKAENGLQKVGFLGLAVDTNKTTVFTQYYKITFSSATVFTVEGDIEGNVGSGNTSQNFTAGNGDFTLSADADFGSFRAGDIFYFMIYTWEPLITDIATLLATGYALIDHFGEDAEDESKMGSSKVKAALKLLDQLKRPDAKDGIRLPNLPAIDLTPEALPYDIDALGRDRTKYLKKDSLGNKGERYDYYQISEDDLI